MKLKIMYCYIRISEEKKNYSSYKDTKDYLEKIESFTLADEVSDI